MAAHNHCTPGAPSAGARLAFISPPSARDSPGSLPRSAPPGMPRASTWHAAGGTAPAPGDADTTGTKPTASSHTAGHASRHGGGRLRSTSVDDRTHSSERVRPWRHQGRSHPATLSPLFSSLRHRLIYAHHPLGGIIGGNDGSLMVLLLMVQERRCTGLHPPRCTALHPPVYWAAPSEGVIFAPYRAMRSVSRSART